MNDLIHQVRFILAHQVLAIMNEEENQRDKDHALVLPGLSQFLVLNLKGQQKGSSIIDITDELIVIQEEITGDILEVHHDQIHNKRIGLNMEIEILNIEGMSDHMITITKNIVTMRDIIIRGIIIDFRKRDKKSKNDLN